MDEVNQRAADSMLEEFGDGETAPIGTQTESIQTTTTQTQTERRPPEDDINYLATTRSKRTPFEAPSVPAPRTSPTFFFDFLGIGGGFNFFFSNIGAII